MAITAGTREHLLEILAQASAHGSALTVLDRDGHSERVTFAELWEQSERVAAAFGELAEPGQTVGATLECTRGCAAAIIGALRAGLQLASLPTRARAMSGAQHAAQLRVLCAATDAVALVGGPATLGDLGELSIPVHAYTALERASGAATRDDGRLVQFTSGSTSQPKGIVLSMERIGIHVGVLAERFELVAGESVVAWLPLSHDMGLIGAFLTSWAAGADLTLIDPQLFVRHPSLWMRTCAETRATLTWGPNFGYALAARTARHLAGMSLASLRNCVVGAEPVQGDTLRAFAAATAPLGFSPRALTPGYGMAEATLGITSKLSGEPWRSVRVDPDALGAGDWVTDADGTEIVSCGVPFRGVELRLDDGPGGVSEILVRSPSMLERYIGAECELVDGEWVATSDLGAIVDGELYICGRRDDLLIVAGRNLYARDLELVVAEHAALRAGSCVAAQREDGRYVIVVEPRAGATVASLREASRWVGQELTSRFGAVPADVVIIARGSLPKTPSGKLARRATARLYAAGELRPLV